MRVVVTGSSGHLGAALVGALQGENLDVLGLDLRPSPCTAVVGSVVDRAVVRRCLTGADAVLHTASLHQPHLRTHSRQAFVDTNVVGTLNVLEEAVDGGVFGRSLVPVPGAAAAWITEDVVPVPKNIYGASKKAAEELAETVHLDAGLSCVILRTSRFFAERDDPPATHGFEDANIKMNELLYRRVDLEDAVTAHLAALDRATEIGFGLYIISATTPFAPSDLEDLRSDAPSVVNRLFPDCDSIYAARGWRLFPSIDRVYVNDQARRHLGWAPRHDFGLALDGLRAHQDRRR
jgi:UDP-glucose 4-epimerase